MYAFRMLQNATKFRTFSQKYEQYEIKSRTKISAITVLNLEAHDAHKQHVHAYT